MISSLGRTAGNSGHFKIFARADRLNMEWPQPLAWLSVRLPLNTGPDIRRVRHELKRRRLSVTQVERLTSKMIRVKFAGDDLTGFTSLGFDDHIKLFLPAGERGGAAEQVEMRDFTPRRYDPHRNELLIDFAVHEAGPATHWAVRAAPGTTLEIGGPRGSFIIPTQLDSHLLVGDETALPAIGRRLEELPGTTHATVVAEIDSEAEKLPLESQASLQVIWVYRHRAQPGSADSLLEALRGLNIPTMGCFAWIAAESKVARRLRQFLVDERGVNKGWVKAAGYWQRGVVGAHDKIED
jgi:NADPH-dependent ferric siderophore reductase